MATIHIRHPHHMTASDAWSRTQALLAKLFEERREYIRSVEWTADAMKAAVNGRGFDGQFKVSEQDITVVVHLGLLTSAFKSKVETRLKQKLDAEFGA